MFENITVKYIIQRNVHYFELKLYFYCVDSLSNTRNLFSIGCLINCVGNSGRKYKNILQTLKIINELLFKLLLLAAIEFVLLN